MKFHVFFMYWNMVSCIGMYQYMIHTWYIHENWCIPEISALESGALPACPLPAETHIICRAVYLFVGCAHFIELSMSFNYISRGTCYKFEPRDLIVEVDKLRLFNFAHFGAKPCHRYAQFKPISIPIHFNIIIKNTCSHLKSWTSPKYFNAIL